LIFALLVDRQETVP